VAAHEGSPIRKIGYRDSANAGRSSSELSRRRENLSGLGCAVAAPAGLRIPLIDQLAERAPRPGIWRRSRCPFGGAVLVLTRNDAAHVPEWRLWPMETLLLAEKSGYQASELE